MDLGLETKRMQGRNQQLVGLHPAGLQALCLCWFKGQRKSSETTTETSIIKRMWELTGLKQRPGATPHLQQYPEGRTWRPKASSLPEECGRGGWITSTKGTDTDLRWALVTMETRGGARSAPPRPFDKNSPQLGPGASTQEDQSHASAQVKQALVRQGMDRGQENSHRLSGLTIRSLLAHHAAVHPQTSLDKDLFNQWKNTQSSGFLQLRCQLGRGQPSSAPTAQDRTRQVIARLPHGAQL